MAIKELFFTIFLIIAISSPFFFKQKGINVSNKINLPEIEVKNGNFKKFTTHLYEYGKFDKIDYINKNNYYIYNLLMHIIEKNAILDSQKVHFDNVYNLYNASYKTDKYIYKAKKIVYNPETKIAISDNFKFFNNKIDGKGKNMVYKDDIITAKNIHYLIKGFK